MEAKPKVSIVDGLPGLPPEDESEVMTLVAPGMTSLAPRTISIDRAAVAGLMDVSLEDAVEKIERREKLIEKLGKTCLAKLGPQDLTLFKDREGHVVGRLRDGRGARDVALMLGISVFNHRRPGGEGGTAPLIREEQIEVEGQKHVCLIAEGEADGYAALTQQPIWGVPVGLRSINEKGMPNFAGRGTKQDLAAAWRTSIDVKVISLLSGLRKMSGALLESAGIDLAKCFSGSGYGSAAERGSKGVAEEGVAEQVQKLREEILKAVGGDTAAAKQLCREITKGDKPGRDGKTFPGFDTPDRLTQGWQIDAAMKKLKAHPQFGGEREPGQD